MPKPKEIKEGKVFAIASYWLILCILPLMLKKDNKFAVHHAKQGLVLFIFLVAGLMINIIPFIGQIIFRVVLFIYFFLVLWGTIAALMGKDARIPVVCDIADKINI